MDPISEGCRLCLDRFAESFTTIDSPDLKVMMEKVFCFSIDQKQGYCSGVCQSCSYAISEFYQYSEKVRHNQEILNRNAKGCDPILDSKVEFEIVKVEMLSDSDLPGTIENACEPKDEVSGAGESSNSIVNACEPKDEDSGEEESSNSIENACEPKDEDSGEEESSSSGHDESYESSPKKLQTRQKRRPGKRGLNEADETKKTLKQTNRLTRKQKFEEEDQLFNKHFRMICDLCNTPAATFSELLSHFRKEHKQRNGYVVCCNKKLNKRSSIRDHIDFHANPDVFRCGLCEKKYKNKEILNEHMLFMHPSAGSFKCDLCPQSFAHKSVLAKHMGRHMKFKCRKCDNEFTLKGSLNYHMNTVHGNKDRKKVCDTCGQTFLCKKAFDRHIKGHMGIKLQQFQCGICQRLLKSENNLRYHMNVVHSEGDRQFQCDICLQKYGHAQALYMHKLRSHAEPNHHCEFCGKMFKHAITLKTHRNIHTGEVLYACEYCGISKNSRQNLHNHIKRHHPLEKAEKKRMKDGAADTPVS